MNFTQVTLPRSTSFAGTSNGHLGHYGVGGGVGGGSQPHLSPIYHHHTLPQVPTTHNFHSPQAVMQSRDPGLSELVRLCYPGSEMIQLLIIISLHTDYYLWMLMVVFERIEEYRAISAITSSSDSSNQRVFANGGHDDGQVAVLHHHEVAARGRRRHDGRQPVRRRTSRPRPPDGRVLPRLLRSALIH